MNYNYNVSNIISTTIVISPTNISFTTGTDTNMSFPIGSVIIMNVLRNRII